MSPSSTPMRTRSRRRARVRRSRVVLPAPGDDMMFTDHSPAAAKSARLAAATRSFSERMSCRTATRADARLGVAAVVADVAVASAASIVVVPSWSWSWRGPCRRRGGGSGPSARPPPPRRWRRSGTPRPARPRRRGPRNAPQTRRGTSSSVRAPHAGRPRRRPRAPPPACCPPGRCRPSSPPRRTGGSRGPPGAGGRCGPARGAPDARPRAAGRCRRSPGTTRARAPATPSRDGQLYQGFPRGRAAAPTQRMSPAMTFTVTARMTAPKR